MKKISIVPPITIPEAGNRDPMTGDRGSLDFDMVKWLTVLINGHEKFGKGFEGISQGIKIKTAFEKAKGHFLLEEPEYRELTAAMNGTPLNPMVGMACMPYYKAVEEAVDVEVTPKTTGKGKKK